uniref:Uncharacterized protein n=1 Tax=Arundo donax TaxID=35708 RepID=A0A0A8Y3L5_ARUDO
MEDDAHCRYQPRRFTHTRRYVQDSRSA